ncbi:MAG: HAD-IB family phosphatase [Gemmatimonadaceae bacterium]
MPFKTVVFDCDSTLSAIEGIDELAGSSPGVREEIVRLTEAAMRGEVPLEQVYGRRLALVKPTRARVETLGARYVAELLPHAREVIDALRAEGVAVRVISGGVLPAVLAVARELGLRDHDVAAVELRFGPGGEYAGYDERSPLARAGGKLTVLQQWRTDLPRPVMLVGDGATDLEARPAVDCFVAFTGIIERPNVVSSADAVVRARTLAPILPLVLGDHAPASPAHRRTYDIGLSFLDESRPD